MIESPTLVSSDVTDYAPSDLIGQKYRLVRFLGEGAQGSVWRAENLALRSDVAIKIVHAEPANPSATLRLEKEARAAAQIAHPAVVRVFDLGRTASGDAFIVMEFLQGKNLGEHLATCGRLSAVEALRTLLPIADVLHVAHARGIVHRDLKPENVFLAKSGSTVQPKLLDFGIAKLRRDREPPDAVITEVGALVGSPAYVSPEQAFCRDDVGQAADVWSFCVVLYECLTGTLPFESDNCRELFRQIGEEAPRPILSHGAGDFELWEIIRRGLEKAPKERWPDMQSLGRALAGWLRARGVEDDISGMRLDSRWLARDRTEPVPIVESFDPPSFVRRIEGAQQNLALRPTERARGVRRPTRFLVVGGLVAATIPILFGFGFVAPDSTKHAEPKDAKLETEVVIQAPHGPGATELAVSTANAETPGELPRSAPALEPRPSQSATPTPSVSPALRAGGVPSRKQARGERRAPDSDLLEPY